MATINGRSNWFTSIGADDGLADTLHGTSVRDVIYGFGGADRLHGHEGNDTIVAGMGNDYVHGGPGNDFILGGEGRDTLYGGSDDDYVDGGAGDDWIRGGTGQDSLYGGSGRDTFSFAPGDNRTIFHGGRDFIGDFNSADDTIYFDTNSPAGNRWNYHEERIDMWTDGTQEGNYYVAFGEASRDFYENYQAGGNLRYVFYTNGDTGYLFADLDHDGRVDQSIELQGLDSLSDFSYTDIH